MSNITLDEVKKLAALARIKLSDKDAARFQKEISSILGFVEQLQKIDIHDIQPTSQVTGLTNVTRDDKVIEYGVNRTGLLKNAPEQQDGFLKVKRVL